MTKSERLKRITESWIYPIALFILPLLTVNQGVDVSDSTYSLGNYMFADGLEGMWVISTYLSNVIGSVIVRLPGGDKLIGANIYTGIILSAIGLIVYFSFKKEFNSAHIFIGECISLCLCWIPTGILYNYASYLFMTIGCILLFFAITKDSRRMMFLAGIVLGINVFVRIPNITQMALILVLWVYAIYTGMNFKNVAAKTGMCIAGYAAGVCIMLIVVIAKYKISGIVEMISGLAAITSTDATYTPLSMIAGTINAYIRSFKWILVILAVVMCGIIMFRIVSQKFVGIKIAVYLCATALMIRFFWGRGMFSFRYYEDYSSMYEWGMVALYLSIILDIYVLVYRGKCKSEMVLLAVMSLVIIMIAPLGSNNYTYQNLNNMFVVMPATVVIGFDAIGVLSEKCKKCYSLPIAVMYIVLLICILVQSFGFNLKFVFRDGMRGEARDAQVEGIESLYGMYTNTEHAQSLMGLNDCIEELKPESLILYGDCPGLTYILRRPSALFTSWADLDSNPVDMIEKDLNQISVGDEYPPVILRKHEGSAVNNQKKLEILETFIDSNDYLLIYENSEFVVYSR